jgi:hypothetical protein
MRYRKWIPIGLGVLLVVGMSLWGMWRLLDVRQRTQAYLLEVMSSMTQGGLSARTVKMTGGSIELGEVRASASGVALEAGRVTISYHLLKLLSSGFDPKASIYDVTLHRPHVLFSWDKKELLLSPSPPLPLGGHGMGGARVRFSEGTVSVRKGEEVWSPDCEFSGSIEGKEDGGIAVRLEGRSEKDGGKLLVEGTIGGTRKAVGLKIVGTSVAIERWGKPLLSHLGVKRGRLDLKADFAKEGDVWRLSGDCALSEGMLDLGPGRGIAEAVSLKGTFAERVLIIEEGGGVLQGQPFRCSGQFRPFDPARIELDISFQEVNIEQIAREFLTEAPVCPTGRGTLNLSLFGPIGSLAVRGRWTSESVSYGGVTLQETSGAFHLSGDTLRVSEVMASVAGGSVRGAGRIALDSTKVLYATLAADSVDVKRMQRLLEKKTGLTGRADAALEVTGTMDHPVWRAEVRIHEPLWAGRRWSDLTGKMEGRDKRLSFALRNREIEGHGTFSPAEGGRLEAEARIERGAVSALEEAGISSEGRMRVWGPLSSLQMEGTLHLSGDWVDGELLFSAVRSEALTAEHAEHAEHSMADSFSVLSDLGGKIGKVTGTFSARALKIGGLRSSFDGNITVGNEAIRVEGSAQDGRLFLWGEMKRRRQVEGEEGGAGAPPHPPSPPLPAGNWVTEGLRGEVVVREFPLSDALGALRIERRNGTGLLDGKMSFEGHEGSGTLRLTDGLLEGVAGLEGNLAFDWDEHGISIRNGFLRTPEETLLSLEQTEEGGLRAKADAIHAASLLCLLHPRAKSVGGLLSYDVSLSEPPRMLKADFDVVGGHIEGIEFDRLEGHLSGHIGTAGYESLTAEHAERVENTTNSPFAVLSGLRNPGGELSVDASFEKSGRYEGRIQGKLPLGPTKEMDLSAHAEGDILALLSPLIPAIRQASGKGQIAVQLTGRWHAPLLRELRIVLEDGSLRSRFLADRITRLKGKVTFDSKRRFVRIEAMSGRVDGDRFWIKNTPQKKGTGKQLTPLVWKRLGISFGVLALGTGEKGVELAIPGLMRAGEKGRLQFLGKTDQEDFLIAGPNKTPRLRGKIKVRNGEFTYPFLPEKSGSDPQKAFKRALKSVCWELDVVSGEDVWYFRDAELAGGGVHLKLVEGDALAFHGVIAEKTFWLDGELKSAEGTVSYLDTEFQIEKAELEINTRYRAKPVLRFLARTTVYDDSTNAATDIFLEAYQMDERTGTRLKRARWGDFEFSLCSSDPKDDSREKILAKLGYMEGEYERRAWGALTLGVESYLLRPLLNPMERQLRRALGLDVVRFQPSIARNLLDRRELLPPDQTASDLALFRGTQWTLGQYVAKDWYLFYTGQLEIGRDAYEKETWGVKHRFGIEFRTGSNTVFQFEYDYDDLLKEGDRQIRMRHWFPF